MKVRRTGKIGLACFGISLLGTRLVSSGPGPGQTRAQVHRGPETQVQDDFQDASNLDADGDGDRNQRRAIAGHVTHNRQATRRFDAAPLRGKSNRCAPRWRFLGE